MLLAKNEKTALSLLPALANRHGLITGATGTGKTLTMQAIAQRLSTLGVPVFMADVKGDFSGIAKPGGGNAKVLERLDIAEDQARIRRLPGRVLGRLRQERPAGARHGVGHGAAAARPHARPERDAGRRARPGVQDRRRQRPAAARPQGPARHAAARRRQRGEVQDASTATSSTSSIGAIQRGLLALESQGAAQFFGEPMLEIADLMQRDTATGQGVVNVLAADQLMNSPKLYSSFLLWLLAELFEQLPEVGDPEKPKLVFFFDEAHLLFDEAPKALLEKVEQVVRLIRSKGVGVYFVTQNPLDVPERVLGQLGNRVQHALRAFTPQRPEGGEDRRRDAAAESKAQGREGHHRAWRGRGAGQPARREGPAADRRARVHRAAGQPGRPAYARASAGNACSARRCWRSTRRPSTANPPTRSSRGTRRKSSRRRTPGARGTARRRGQPGVGHHFRQDRAARRPAIAGHPRGHDEERRAQHRLRARPPDAARRTRLDPRQRPASLNPAAYRGWGIAFAVVGVLAFSLRPILIKLSYASHPVSPNTLLFLRMTLSLPFFLAVGWWLRRDEPRLERRDWAAVIGARLPRLLRRELPRLRRPAMGRRRHRPPDPVPLSDAGAAAFVPLPAQDAHAARDRRAPAELRRHRARGVEPDRRGAEGRLFLFGALLVFASALLLRGLSRRRQPGGEARRLDALHRVLHGSRHRAGGDAVPRFWRSRVLRSLCPAMCGSTPSCSPP